MTGERDPDQAVQPPVQTEEPATEPASDVAPEDLPTSGELDAAPHDAVVGEAVEDEVEDRAQPDDDLDELLDMAGAADTAAVGEEDGAAGEQEAAEVEEEREGEEPAAEADEEPAAEADEEPAAGADEEPAAEAGEEPDDEVRLRRPTSVADCRERRDLLRLPGDWFVVHTYSGYEQRVKDNLESRVEALDAHDRIYEVIIPTDEVVEFKRGKRQTVQRKFLPGYVLVRMDMDDETWGIVRNTPAVTGFVGPPGTKPVPLSLREVAQTLKIPETLAPEVEAEEAAPAERQLPEIDLEVGETVRVTTGPFADFTGTIAEINLDQHKLRVMVSVFGRETPLELPFDNVAKL